jgi:hypothetical protein
VGQVRETDFKCLGFQRRIKEPMDSGMFSFYQFIVKFMIVKILEFIVCYVNNIMFYKPTYMSMVWLYNPPDCICEMLKAEIPALSDSI